MRFLAIATLVVALIIPEAAWAQKGKGGGGGNRGGGGGRPANSNWSNNRPSNSNWSGGNWNGNRSGNWNGGNWNGGNWNHGGYYDHNNNWVPYAAFGLGYALGGWGWGGYGGDGYSPGYYGTYDYPSYGYPNDLYDSNSRVSGYYDPASSSANSISPNRVGLEIVVPDPNAQLLIQGEPMRTTGTRRLFVSPDLQPGKTYTYTITLKRNVNGRTEDDIRELDVRPGSVRRVDFSQPQIQTLPVPRSEADRIPAQRESQAPRPVPPR